jgi:hypothetical protein
MQNADAQMALAAFAWFLLSSFVSVLDRDAASGIDTNISVSKWLGVIFVKCSASSSVRYRSSLRSAR